MPSAIRILHLLDQDADFESRQGVRQLEQGLGKDFQTASLTVGSAGLSSILRAMRQLRTRRAQFDLLHAWGNTALTAAALAWNGPILFSPPPVLTNRALRWLSAAMTYRNIHVVCPAANQQRRVVGHGIPIDHTELIRPGVDFSRLRRRRDEALRQRLRLTSDDFVLLAVGESTRGAGHLQAIWTAGILHVMDPRYKIVVWGRGPLAGNLQRQGPKMGAANALRFATGELGMECDFDQLFAAADLVLIPAQGAVSTLPIALAMGAALPIIATASPYVSELLEDRHTALMTTDSTPRVIARRVLEFRDATSLQWSLADRARAEAYDFFSQSRFLEEFRKLYQRIRSAPRRDPSPSPQ